VYGSLLRDLRAHYNRFMSNLPYPNSHRARREWILALFGTLLFAAVSLSAAEPEASGRLTIDYGDGVQKVFTNLAWQEGQTVLAALETAAKHPRGIKFEHRGSGATAFITSIDGQKNEGIGRNWFYEVNGKPANKSCGVWTLQAGDQVLWRFGKQE
jgi:hypothetical protein